MPKRILVVDDSARMSRIISRTASTLDYTSRECNDPHRALDAFIEFAPDVVVLDLCMPEKDGIDVLEEILLIGTDARIILTSGHAPAYFRAAEDVAAFHDHRNLAILPKPFRRDDLLRELAQVAD